VLVVRDFLDRNGVRVRVLGNISLLPLDIQQLMAEGAEMTKHNDRLFNVYRKNLNIIRTIFTKNRGLVAGVRIIHVN